MRDIKGSNGEIAGRVAAFNELTVAEKFDAEDMVVAMVGRFSARHYLDRMEFVLAPLSTGWTLVDARLP
jgi:hypothetical protein